MIDLFTPLRLGALELPNRIVLAPLTRCRTGEDRLPNPLMVEYYRQRAGAGLIISEATSIHPMGVGYPRTPGIWSMEQVDAWKAVTRTVHEAGGRIFMQLWHVGRLSHESYLDGEKPVAPSAIQPEGHPALLRPKQPYPVPRPLERSEIPDIVAAYRQAAGNALLAGFDGVEIHGANGYLLDQFLQDSTNQRDDDYGGPVDNRARLMLEVVDAAIAVWGANRVGVHLAPRGDAQSMGDSDPVTTFGYVARELGRRRIAFICAREHEGPDSLGPQLKAAFGGPYIANERFTRESAQAALAAGRADAVAFGIPFISNPDLPERFAHNLPLNPVPPTSAFYSPGAEGYIDFPMLEPTITT
ncbi:MAG: alkene reductase [Proteobacteria bacterium]|nr:alkene reductase [Pseudomonadota bacterium]HQR03469.1 alkene reductase [Rhodocyclaceae bacterium]